MSDQEPLFSSSWYRVACLKPRLRAHTRIHRHSYRDQVWYVLEDTSNGRCHRFSAAAHDLIGRMDGAHTVQQIWDTACAELGDDAPTQDETIRLLGQLHAADALKTDALPDTAELFRRHDKQRLGKLRQRFMYPLAIRIPLIDPDRFLGAALPLVRPLFSAWGFGLWLVLVLTAAVMAASHWPELTGNLADRVLTPQNLLVLWLAYPLVKALHELGHGFATKRWGGEVHEIGIMLLVLMPVPYVEASSASAFQDKRARMVVGAAGIMVELLLAAVALLVWLNVEPGLVRTLAWNVMLIGGVSTLLFNGNPLLRFDGYYVLSDAIEMPNLATRSNRWLLWLAQRYLLGNREIKAPLVSPGERPWLLGYGVAAFVYRLFILFAIALFIASRFFILGVLLALWAVAAQVIWPLLKGLAVLFSSPQFQRGRGRAVAASLGIVVLLLAVVGLLPVPAWTRAQGVVWLPEDARLRAGADGLITQVLAADGGAVSAGEPIIDSDDPLLAMNLRLLKARRAELDAELIASEHSDRTRAQVVREEIAAVEADLARARERLAALTLTSPVEGALVLPDAEDLVGQFVHRGDLLGYVIPAPEPGQGPRVRVVLEQDAIGLVRERTRGVEVWPAGYDGGPLPATIVRQVPAGTDRLPAAQLGVNAGGGIAVDPRDPNGLRTLQPVFELDLALPPQAPAGWPGSRVAVRFDHGMDPLALQWYRALRRLFLSRFAV